MSVSVVIVTGEDADNEKVKNFWTPVKLKYKGRPEVEFIIAKNKEDGIHRSKYNAVFITPWNMVPTYKALLAIESLNQNQCLLPRVHGEDGKLANAFSINKNRYKGESLKEWSSTQGITVVEDITMYEV